MGEIRGGGVVWRGGEEKRWGERRRGVSIFEITLVLLGAWEGENEVGQEVLMLGGAGGEV